MSEPYNVILRQERKKRGMTIEDMAEALGVSTITISSWERGKSRPKEESRNIIMEKLGIVLEVDA